MNPEFDAYASKYRDLLRDPIRDRFASDPRFFHRRKLDVILEFLAEQNIASRNLSWLDLGCGRGELLRLGAAQFARAQGCDPSPAMMAAGTSIELRVQEKANELPFPESSVDLVTAACVYHHVIPEEREALTSSVYRVLKPNGIFCVLEHNPLNPVTRVITSRCPVDRNAELITAQQASRIMRSSRLRVVATRYFLYIPEQLFQLAPGVERSLRRLPFGGQFAIFGLKPRNTGD